VTYGKKFIGFLLCFDICPCWVNIL
jgi:hypothetical protein